MNLYLLRHGLAAEPGTHGSSKDEIYGLWVDDFNKITESHHTFELVASALLFLAVITFFIPGFEKMAAVPLAFSGYCFYAALARATRYCNQT